MALTTAGFKRVVPRPSVEARNAPVPPGTKVYKLRLLRPFGTYKAGEFICAYGCDIDEMKRAGMMFDNRAEIIGSSTGDPLRDGVTYRMVNQATRENGRDVVKILCAQVGCVAPEVLAVPPVAVEPEPPHTDVEPEIAEPPAERPKRKYKRKRKRRTEVDD